MATPQLVSDMEKPRISLEENAAEIEKQPTVTESLFIADPVLERRLTRKIDLRMIPICMVMYCLNYLDRNNIGNAKTAGMQADLDLSSSDYSLAVGIFFVGYLCFQAPSTFLLTKSKPRLFLPGIMFVWGCIVLAYTGVNSKAGLIGVRAVLGVVEAGFFTGVLMYMSMWYRKHELAKRFSLFYSASLLSGAFGGLLAGGIISGLSNNDKLPPWKWLFLVEGCMTIAFSLAAFFILPDFPSNTRWLTQEERDYAVARLVDEATATQGVGEPIPFLKALKLAVKDWRMWLFAFAQSVDTCAGTITYFIPTLVSSLGYTGQTAQYMTVPLYLCGAVILLTICFSSDLQSERPKHLMVATVISFVSFAIVAGVNNPAVRYTFMTFGTACTWTCAPMVLVYVSNVLTAPYEVRALQVGILNGVANFSSVYGSYIWPASSAPQYIPGFVTVVMLQFACFVSAVAAWYFIPGHGGRKKIE